MDDPARAKALKEREEEERIRERETLERKQARARTACASCCAGRVFLLVCKGGHKHDHLTSCTALSMAAAELHGQDLPV